MGSSTGLPKTLLALILKAQCPRTLVKSQTNWVSWIPQLGRDFFSPGQYARLEPGKIWPLETNAPPK